jgi:hypothetical protein
MKKLKSLFEGEIGAIKNKCNWLFNDAGYG